MEKNRSIATLRIVGGHPCLDLANTVAFRSESIGPDLLASYGDLLDWSCRVGLLQRDGADRLRRLATAAPQEAEAALDRVRRLREAVFRTFSAVAGGGQPSASDLEQLDREARHAQIERRLARKQAGFAWIWLDGGMDAVTARLAHAAAELLTGPEVGRVKLCRGTNCGWLFLDTSRNGSRKWCSEEDCGSPARVARHRAKDGRMSSGGSAP